MHGTHNYILIAEFWENEFLKFLNKRIRLQVYGIEISDKKTLNINVFPFYPSVYHSLHFPYHQNETVIQGNTKTNFILLLNRKKRRRRSKQYRANTNQCKYGIYTDFHMLILLVFSSSFEGKNKNQ